MDKELTAIRDCVSWNAARYDRVSNAALSRALLEEELDELSTAQNLVDIADACGDILFVCIGSLWKLGFSAFYIQKVLDRKVNVKEIMETTVLFDASSGTEELIRLIYISVNSTLPIVARYHGIAHCMDDILAAVCKSNNTKSVAGKTDPSIKANIDKGPNYVSPTKDLVTILENRNKE